MGDRVYGLSEIWASHPVREKPDVYRVGTRTPQKPVDPQTDRQVQGYWRLPAEI